MEDLIVTPYDIDTTLGVEEVDEKKGKKENNGAEFMQEMFQNEEFRNMNSCYIIPQFLSNLINIFVLNKLSFLQKYKKNIP